MRLKKEGKAKKMKGVMNRGRVIVANGKPEGDDARTAFVRRE